MAKQHKGCSELFDWEKSGFYKGYVANKANSKVPSVAYTKEENHIDLETARGNNSFSGILDKNTVLMECDDKQNSDILMKIVQGEHLKILVTDRKGGQGLHSLFFNNGDFTTATKIVLAIGITVDMGIYVGDYDCQFSRFVCRPLYCRIFDSGRSMAACRYTRNLRVLFDPLLLCIEAGSERGSIQM